MITCNYILIMQHSRGCRIEDCTHWKEGFQKPDPTRAWKAYPKPSVRKKKETTKKISTEASKKIPTEAKKRGRKGIPCKDYLGNQYATLAEMFDKYKIDQSTYMKRLKRGLSLEETLTGKRTGKKTECVDHKGNHYEMLKDMANAYGVNPGTLSKRLRKGWTVQEALEGRSST